MVLERSSADDPLLRVAMSRREPFAWDDLRKAPVNRLARFADVGPVTRALVCPITYGPRWLGTLELVDPFDNAPFSSEDIQGARYVAERYATFVVSHGIITDVGAVAQFAARSCRR